MTRPVDPVMMIEQGMVPLGILLGIMSVIISSKIETFFTGFLVGLVLWPLLVKLYFRLSD